MNNNTLDPRRNGPAAKLKVLNREIFYKGKDIIKQGDEAYRAYYIEKGIAAVFVQDGQHELQIAELGPGDVFGEMALITSKPRSATVRALTDCTVSIISRAEIESKIQRLADPAIQALIRVLAERLRDTTWSQFQHYLDLAEFQDRVTGVVDRVRNGIDEKKRMDFRRDVEPLLADLQNVLDRYKGAE